MRSLVRRFLPLALLGLCPVTLPAQAVRGPTTIRRDLHHDVSLPLTYLIRMARPISHGKLEAGPRRAIPLPPKLRPMEEDPIRQYSTNGFSPQVGLNFEGIGDGQYGFTVEDSPADANGAAGTTEYVQWVNTDFAVFDKTSGSLIAGPTPGNTLWTGFGGGCEINNDGEPIVTFDKLANRWVLSQISVSTTPYLQCVAVSVTPDATGPWYRYSFQYSYFNDNPKMGVWPDAYYETFDMFDGDNLVGADACAYNRMAMLSGQAATQVCFQQQSSVSGLLPSDVDGATPPPAGSPDYMLNLGANSLNLYKFHVDFNHPANSTFTGPTVISVAAFTALCNGQWDCVPQAMTGNKLDSLADRLMYRLAYRRFADHESLVVNHSVAVNGSGGIRWYEIRSPGGTPVIAQQGTYAPDSNYRWMGSIAMDKIGDIAVGYSVSSAAIYPSIAIAGRVPSDPAGVLEAETTVIAGGGSQTPNVHRWGDYSAMTVDPIDDCTFWYTQQYLVASGAYNWHTRIVSFQFPGCLSGDYLGFYPESLSYGDQNIGSTSPPQPVSISNHTSAPLTISRIAASGDYHQSNGCGSSLAPGESCTINVSFRPTAAGIRTGTLTVTDSGPGSPLVVPLTGVGTEPESCVVETLSNGGFEAGTLDCWTAGGVLTPAVSTMQAHSGAFSAQLGATGLPEPNGDSWIYQTVTVPSTVQTPTLSFWYWPWTSDSVQYDWQEAEVRDTNGNKLAQIFKTASNAQVWTYVSYDLTPYEGQTIQLYFNVHEDGYGNPTYMYLDDVAIAGAPVTQRFIAVAPCRVVDTRNSTGTFGGPFISGGTSRDFPIPQASCGIPASATSYALNVTVVPHGALDYLTVWPTGSTRPVVSTLNSGDGRVKANAAIVPAGAGEAISVYATNTTDVILDIAGYFTTTTNSTLAFFPLTPCRVADTRLATGPLGGPILHRGQQRDFPVQASACNIPSAAQAYSMNFTVIPKNGKSLGYLTVWPKGQSQPTVSTLNAPTGTITANAAIVPAGTGGDIETYAYGNDTDLIFDINGYFAPASSGSNPMSLYNLAPCRVLDTRLLPPQLPFSGERTVNVEDSSCGVPGNATGFVLNATVVPPGPLGYLTLWPDGQSQPLVSTLNAVDGSVTSNMAIVPTINESIDAFAHDATYLILDISAYFAP